MEDTECDVDESTNVVDDRGGGKVHIHLVEC